MSKRNRIVVGVWLLVTAIVSGRVEAQQITKSASPTVQPPGNVGRITKWTGASNSGIGILGDSILTESGSNILIQSSVAIGNNNGILQLLWNNGGVYEPFFRLRPVSGIGPSTIGGWTLNNVLAGVGGATVFGGGVFNSTNWPNTITNPFGTIGGGLGNYTGDGTGPSSSIFGQTISGGFNNIAQGHLSTIGGGIGNGTPGIYSVIPGGYQNTANGANSFAAGTLAQANHQGAFVWADSTSSLFKSSNQNEFSARAGGGFRFATQVDSSGNPTAGIFVNSLGNVGINATNPTSTLSVAGTIGATGGITTGGGIIFHDGSLQTTATFVNPGAGLQAAGGPGNETLSIPAGGILNSMLGSGAVGSANIAPGAVGSTQLASNAVLSSNISPGAVGNTQLQSNAVTSTNIASGQVVKSINAITDAVTLQAGSNLTITPSGNTLTITASGSRRAALGQFWTTTPNYASAFGGLGTTAGVGTNPNGSASDGADVWVTSGASNTVSRVRGSDGKLLDTWTGAALATQVLVAMGRIFVVGQSNPGALYLIDPTQQGGAVIEVTNNALGNSPVNIAFDGSRIWTSNTGNGGQGSISIITPGATLPWSVTNITNGFSIPSGIVFDGSNMWVTDDGPNKLFKLDQNGAIIQDTSIGIGGRHPVFDGTNIWVPNAFEDTVTVVSAATGVVVRTLTGNGMNLPTHVAFDGQRILVTNTRAGADSVSLWKASDFSQIGSFSTGSGSNPNSVCSDGVYFWITLNFTSQLARF